MRLYDRASTALVAPLTAPTVVLTMLPRSWPSVARTGFKSRESRTSPIMSTRLESRASRRTFALTFWMRSETRSMDAVTPALKDSSCKTSACRLILAVMFSTTREISPTCTLALRNTSGIGLVVETFGVVEFVAYTTDSGSPSAASEYPIYPESEEDWALMKFAIKKHTETRV